MKSLQRFKSLKSLAASFALLLSGDAIWAANDRVPIHQGLVSINVGGQALIAADGRNFSEDVCDRKIMPQSSCRTMAGMKGTQDPLLYQSYRSGPQNYRFDVPEGRYAVTLHFAEPATGVGADSVFHVEIGGRRVLSDFSVKANRDGHSEAALSRTFVALVKANDGIDLRLVRSIGQPILSGLEIYAISGPSPFLKGSLVWSDEFEGAGSETVASPDENRWVFDVWPPGKVNSEDQAYTDRVKNARVAEGWLVIEAHKESYGEAAYTSARLHTLGKLDLRYGAIEVRARLPKGQGTWPAIWMLPSDPFQFATTCDASVDSWQGNADCDAWPNSGEIDIMEHVGFDPGVVHGTVHTQAYYWAKWNQHKGSVFLNDFDDFHRYQLVWTEQQMLWLVDDIPYYSYVRSSNDWRAWPFSEPFHLILNLAIGGNWGRAGGPIDDASLPAQFAVDYVRIYELPED